MNITTTIEHRSGCPDPRTETYLARRSDGTTARVTRCVECGAHVVDGGPPS